MSIDRRRQAFTLIEIMVASAIGSILLLSAGMLASYSARSYAAMTNYVDLDNKSRKALNILTRDVRQASYLSSYTSQQLVFTDYDNTSLSYTYNPGAKTLVRLKDDVSQTLLTECDFLQFNIYQRNPVGGSYDQYPTATATNCKVVQVSWVCSRQILGARINTESVQSAKIVIRKQ